MSITSLLRNYNGNPNIVTIVTDDDLTAITTPGYWALPETVASVAAVQNGLWQWELNDLVLINFSPSLLGFFVFDAVNNSFSPLSEPGELSDALPSSNIFVGNASNIATGVPMTGDIGINNAGVTAIQAGVIVNADINASAAIAYSKLAALPDSNILVGSAGNVATAVAMSGDIAIDNAGVTSIAAGVIVNADVNAAAAIDYSKLASLTSGNILVGSAGNVATSVAMSGDATIVASGALTIANDAITTAKILNANVTLAKLASGIAPSHVIKFANQVTTVGGAAAEAFTVTGAVGATDRAFVQVVDNGTANVTVLQAVVTDNTLTVTFSADPGNDTIINYQLIRVAS